MKVVADDKIPFLKGVLEQYDIAVDYIAGAKTTTADLIGCDALITRTRTKCNQALLAGSGVKFIATATIGFDHIDAEYARQNNIFWTNAPGCNSSSVAQYMTSLLLNWAVKYGFSLQDKVLGVVGVGHVGSKVARVGEALGMKVLLNDPPRARAEGAEKFVELAEIIRQSDIITVHVPLEHNGSDPTYHLVDQAFLSQLAPHQLLVNASRGEVVDNAALREALKKRQLLAAALDVWENEPAIDRELLDLLDYATPHIAGYSTDGKANGTSMSVRALAEFFGLSEDLKNWYPDNVPMPEKNLLVLPENGSLEARLLAVISQSYNIADDTARLRNAPEEFEKLRGSYPLRREFHNYYVSGADGRIGGILEKLGFKSK
ncbi:MAG: 4-phosphoerythronate dehydrogenase PdxB [Lentisphaerae bacterium]|nr:4-phosphoerythronate dehydrogenase PdxB [Lentisphaerota bacterium]